MRARLIVPVWFHKPIRLVAVAVFIVAFISSRSSVRAQSTPTCAVESTCTKFTINGTGTMKWKFSGFITTEWVTTLNLEMFVEGIKVQSGHLIYDPPVGFFGRGSGSVHTVYRVSTDDQPDPVTYSDHTFSFNCDSANPDTIGGFFEPAGSLLLNYGALSCADHNGTNGIAVALNRTDPTIIEAVGIGGFYYRTLAGYEEAWGPSYIHRTRT